MKRLLVIAIALVCAGKAAAGWFDEANRNVQQAHRDLEVSANALTDHLDRQGEAEQRRLDADYTHRQTNQIIMELQPPY